MRKSWIVLLAAALACAGCNDSKPKNTYDVDRVENEKHPQTVPDSVPQAGVDALKKIKQISKEEEKKVNEEKKVVDQAESQ